MTWTQAGYLVQDGDHLVVTITQGCKKITGTVSMEDADLLYLEGEPAPIIQGDKEAGDLHRSREGDGIVATLPAGSFLGSWRSFCNLITGTQKRVLLGSFDSET